jgi:4-hydroxy 2-oxovalerate aldolase
MKANILDCTLRDGGYYNSWNFSSGLVSSYLKALSSSSISHIELGFRFLSGNNDLGPFAFSSEELINSIEFPNNKNIGVMINGSEYLDKSNSCIAIQENFVDSKISKINFVRIAIDLLRAPESKVLVDELHGMGYQVMLNLMQANLRTSNEIIKTAKIIQRWNKVEVLYFADSLGSMNSKSVQKFCKSLKVGWKGKIGFHAHNNQNLALSNAIAAINHGCQFCDSTILGMGRGAGNAQTENLLFQSGGFYESSSMLNALTKFNKLKEKFKWGPNIFYQIASQENVHPTYVQRMLSDKRYSKDQVLRTLNTLKKIESTSYNEENMTKLTYFHNKEHQGRWSAKGFLTGKKVLLIGAGPKLKKYEEKIKEFIKKEKPYVISLNVNQILDKKYFDAVIASNIDRVLLDADIYPHFKCPIIMPHSCFSPIIQSKLQFNEILDYGMAIKQDNFRSYKKGCISNWKEVLAYSLLFIEQADPKSLFLAGFDGYSQNDLRYHENNKIFIKYFSKKNSLKPTLLTPSSQSALKSFEQ